MTPSVTPCHAGPLGAMRCHAKAVVQQAELGSGPSRARTCDLGIKSPLLYQLSYRPAGRLYARPCGDPARAGAERSACRWSIRIRGDPVPSAPNQAARRDVADVPQQLGFYERMLPQRERPMDALGGILNGLGAGLRHPRADLVAAVPRRHGHRARRCSASCSRASAQRRAASRGASRSPASAG